MRESLITKPVSSNTHAIERNMPQILNIQNLAFILNSGSTKHIQNSILQEMKKLVGKIREL